MNREENRQARQEHIRLHRALDQLSACYIKVTGKLLSETTVMELLQWSNKMQQEGHE